MKKIKLGAKIATGFGSLLIIMLALGGLSIYDMTMVKTASVRMNDEYVTEVQILSHLERRTHSTMFNIRGYSMSTDRKYLDLAKQNLATVKESLSEAQALVAKFPELTALKANAEKCSAKLAEYESLAQKTEEGNDRLAELRKKMDSAASNYMKNSNGFLASQNDSLKAEINSGASAGALVERSTKISLVNKIINLGDKVRVENFKAQAAWDPGLLEKTLLNFAQMDKKLDELKAITHKQKNLDEIENTRAAAAGYRTAMEEFLSTWQGMRALDVQRGVVGNAVLGLVSKTVEAGLAGLQKLSESNVSDLNTASLVLVAGLVAALLLGLAMAVFITLGITRPIRTVINGLTAGSQQVAAASNQVSTSSQSLAQGAAEQAASLEETSSSLEEMSSMTRKNAGNAQEADTLAQEARQVVGHANQAMTELTTSMVEITQAGEETGKIIKTIDEIAFQTNLLALNAAVEAARAGEAGAGFAVVADEVRNLAMRAAEAAKNTADLLESTINKTKQGSELVSRTNQAFQEVAANSERVGELVGEIAAASSEQAQGIGQVNIAMTEMDKVTQNNAANAEESAAAAEELSAQAETMQGFVINLASLVGQSSRNGNGNGQGRLHTNRKEGRRRGRMLQLPASKNKRAAAEQANPPDEPDENSFGDF